MIAIFIVWAYIFFISFTYGLIFYKVTLHYKIIFLLEKEIINPILLSITGLYLIMCFLGYYSIWAKIGFAANMMVSLPALLYYICNLQEYNNYVKYIRQKVSSMPKSCLVVLIIYIIAAIILSLIGPHSYDTGLYHAQAIQWLERYKTVPGLGNLHQSLAYNSHFFLPTALFSFSFVNLQPYHVLNSYLWVLFIFLTIGSIGKTNGKSIRLLLYAPIVVLGFYLFRYNISSPDTDISAALCIWFISYIILEKIIEKTFFFFDFYYLSVFVLIFSAVTIKISALLMFLFIPYFIFLLRKSLNSSRLFFLCGLAVVIIIPWLIRNIIVSGYLTIALPAIDMFNFDWKMPKTLLIDIKNCVRSWALLPRRETAEVLAMKFNIWFPLWFKALSVVQKAIFFVIVTSPFFIGLKLFRHPNRIIPNIHFIILWFISLIANVIWFLTAPDFRFAYGIIILSFVLTLFLFLEDFHILAYRIIPHSLFLFGILGILISLFIAKRENLPFPKCLLIPQGYRRAETITRPLRNVVVLIPKSGDQCWNEPVPCTPYFKDNIELRGKDIASGFRLKK